MPEVTDLQKVAQYVKSDKTAPSEVYNAACRMLDAPERIRPADPALPIRGEELERLRAELEKLRTARDEAHSVAEKWFNIAINDGRVIESVRQYAAELRTYCSPAGVAAVYADRIEELLPPRALDGAESHGDADA
jgi:hypothetical protein